MSREPETKNLLLLDKRTVERNIRKGLISRKDVEKALKTLPDVSDKAAPHDYPPPPDDDDEEVDEAPAGSDSQPAE